MAEIPKDPEPETVTLARVERNASGKANIVFDASKIDLFQMCEAKFDMRVNKNKTLPMIKKSKNLDYGTLAHVGLETYFKQLGEGLHYSDRMHNTLLSMRAVASDVEQSNADEDEVQLVCNAVEESCDYWRAEDEQLVVLAVEAPFDYLLYEDDYVRIILSGKIDLLADLPALGRNAGYTNLPFDHKTYSRDFPVYRLSNQFINYAAVTGSNFLIVNRIGLQKTLKPQEKFKRPPLSYDPEIIQQWKDNIVSMILNRYLTCVSTGVWTMNFTSCYKFNRLCEYYEVCDTAGNDTKIWKLESNFVDAKPWDKYGKASENA